ncbi:SDR family oxidoreductase [Lysinibacillus sp. NPDC056959]|uniref:SDR family oxidoreductase n=1 Tax=Lysinibacillus sp. NPDC056959 TaxID=3345981 RepID=UPI00362D1167
MEILITGATGQLGGKIVEYLAKKMEATNTNIIAGTTNTESEKAQAIAAKGIEVRKTDFENQASLVEAFKGVDKVYIVSTLPDVELAVRQQTNIVEAAKQTGVQHIVYSSAPKADTSAFVLAAPHRERENILKQSEIPYTIVRNNWYVENELASIQQSLNGAPWLTSAGEGKVGWALRDELAEATANVLAKDGHENKVYELGGVPYTQAQFVATVNEITGKNIQVMNADSKTYGDVLKQANLPEPMIGMLSAIQEGIKTGGLDNSHSDLEMLLGRKPAALKEALQQILAEPRK